MAIQIGKYNRPGIFIEEIDQSVFITPVVDGIDNLVIGVSKKGPVNTPIRLTTVNELEAVFGQLDRNLERKGSFFHRTVSKMLETSPVYAINLLSTDDTLDTIEYKSLSTSASFKNDIIREGAYRRFFDTTGFWRRDTEAFTNLAKTNPGSNERALGFTNLSDRNITVFIVKTQVSGFDRTLLEWYGSVEKMPQYVNQADYASDYMVDVVIVGGDWSNYQELAVDPRWSSYFNVNGLIKNQLRNFANDRNITLLGFYEGLSLIPFFRDLNGRNIFIESNINRDTDTTGLFCSFNADLVEQDFYTGLVDLLGISSAGKGETEIDFLSYKETIVETATFTNKPLDLPGNVTALFGTVSYYGGQGTHAFGTPTTSGVITSNDRTGFFGEGSVNDIIYTSSSTASNTLLEVVYTVGPNAFGVIGNAYVPVDATTATFSISSDIFANSTATASYFSAVVLDTTGVLKIVNGVEKSKKPSVSSGIVLGFVEFKIKEQKFVGTVTPTHVSVDATEYVDFVLGIDYTVTETTPGSFKVEFLSTINTSNVTDYEQARKINIFNRLVSLIDSPNKNRMTMLTNKTTFDKYSLENVTITNIVTSKTQNKSFVLNTGLSSTPADILTGFLVFYTNDNELILGAEGGKTKNDVANLSGEGVVAKYSSLYTSFQNGLINTGDFFYTNRLYVDSTNTSNSFATNLSSVGVDFVKPTTGTYSGVNFVVFNAANFDTLVDLQALESLVFPSSTSNKGTYTIVGSIPAANLSYGAGYFAYEVTENVINESLTDVNLFYSVSNTDLKHYLKMYTDLSGNVVVELKDELLQSNVDIDTEANATIYVQSEKSNLKQTLEIEVPSGYIEVPNKVLVKGDRYTEVRVGDFLLADNSGVVLEPGQEPRRLTRILSKRQFAGDTTLTEITCDAKILKVDYLGDLQTTRYSSIDQYASTYKGISLKGFRLRTESLPDGTEARQNQILNLVAKGTPLFKSLINKEAFDFRYLIDSFGLGLTERSKQQLVDICGERLDVFGFINMPSIKSFKQSSSPTFTNNEGVLKVEYIAQGGNPESNPAFLYSFGEGVGTTCVGYFTPYVTVNDNGRPLDFPPASFVATTYIRKHISNIGTVTPWTIAAGVTNGRITGISGLEIDFDPEDIGFLNQAQMNPLVFKKNRGYIIETENTALTLYRSSLSLIHVREVLVELERELSRMLLDYQWRFNTPDVRAEIKLRADVICETYVSRNGLFNYFNKMDDENNTAEIIDNQIGVLDTYVEPIKGMGIIVNNITILRTGAISAGGFINQ